MRPRWLCLALLLQSLSSAQETCDAGEDPKCSAKKQKETSGPTNLEGVTEWLVQNGADIDVDEPRLVTKDNREMISNRKFEEEEAIAKIPIKCLITGDLMKAKSPIVARILNGTDADDDKLHQATVWFLTEQQDDPFWAPYIQSLPKSFTSTLVWSPEELAMLEGTWTMIRTQELLDKSKSHYDDLMAAEPQLQGTVTLEDWTKTYVSVTSRDFGVDAWDDAEGVHHEGFAALIPWADLYNHVMTGSHKASWKMVDKELVWYATKDIRPGEPITTSYGAKGNQELLVQYGFTEVDSTGTNPYNLAEIVFALRAGDPLFERRRNFIWGQTRYTCTVTAFIEGEKTNDCLSRVRILVATESETDFSEVALAPINHRNEMATLKALAFAAEEALARFPNDIQEDRRLLAAGGLTYNQRNAIMARLGEKEVLIGLTETCEAGIGLLQKVEASVNAMKWVRGMEGWLAQVVPVHKDSTRISWSL